MRMLTAIRKPLRASTHVVDSRNTSALRPPPTKQEMHASAIGSEHAFDFARVTAGAPSIQRKPSIGAADDAFEREADAVADRVMRMAEPSSPGTAPVAIQRKCAACEDEEKKKIQPKRADSASANTVSGAEAAVHATGTGGQSLPSTVRAYFEPRFGYDFSGVRIHADDDAARAAHAIQARAYTWGRDIVFGSGEYAPSTASGRRLLAHELTHVVQQAGSRASSSIQRAKIPYGPLTWADFKGPAPAKAPESAGVLSAFDIPGTTVSPNATKTKTKCKADGKSDFKYAATIAADPAQLDALAPYMDQDRSWVQDPIKGDGTASCAGEATQCERDFDAKPDAEKAMCERKSEECKKMLHQSRAFVYESEGESVTIDKAVDCEMKFMLRCQSIASKHRLITKGSATATTKKDCKGKFNTQCKVDFQAQKAALLRHEQGHFDITKTIADNARKSLKDKAATMSFNASACGQVAALDAVQKLYDPEDQALRDLGAAWQAQKEKAQKKYDDVTHNGTDAAQQVTWEGKIKSGLKEYDPTATPPTPGKTAPTQAPVAPTPATKP